jgi:hypothetical protein
VTDENPSVDLDGPIKRLRQVRTSGVVQHIDSTSPVCQHKVLGWQLM